MTFINVEPGVGMHVFKAAAAQRNCCMRASRLPFCRVVHSACTKLAAADFGLYISSMMSVCCNTVSSQGQRLEIAQHN